MYYVPCRPPRRLVITPYSCPTAYRDMNGERGSRDRRKEGEKEADWWPRFRGPTDSVQVSKTDMRPVWMMKTKGRKAPRDKNCVDAMTLMRQKQQIPSNVQFKANMVEGGRKRLDWWPMFLDTTQACPQVRCVCNYCRTTYWSKDSPFRKEQFWSKIFMLVWYPLYLWSICLVSGDYAKKMVHNNISGALASDKPLIRFESNQRLVPTFWH